VLVPRLPVSFQNVWSATMRAGSRYGSGVRTTALTTLNIAVVAPMPSATVRIAVAAKPGWRIRFRTA
jgi:hypothetical protein